MEPLKQKSSKGKWSLLAGIASGFVTLFTLAIILGKDADAEIMGSVGLVCSSICLFLLSGENRKGKACKNNKPATV
jgi:hypothetical protein